MYMCTNRIISQCLQLSNFNSKLEKCKEFERITFQSILVNYNVHFLISHTAKRLPWKPDAQKGILSVILPLHGRGLGGWGLCGSCEEDRKEKELSLLQGGRVNCK